jgi:nucleoside-diphosphate-sugar epimerase
MIYGKYDAGWTARIQERVTKKRILPLPGGGRAKIQPLYVKDAARAVLTAALEPGAEGKAFNLGGPEAIEHRAFLRLARDRLKGNTVLLPLPLWPFSLAGRFLGGRFRAMAAFGSEDHLVDIEPARKALNFDPCPPNEGLALTFPDGSRT